MGMTTENSAPLSASRRAEEKDPKVIELIRILTEYCLIMMTADELL